MKKGKKPKQGDDIEQWKDSMLEDFERGEFKSVDNLEEEMQTAKTAADNYVKRDNRINIRLSGPDLEKLRLIAEEEGLPYQTLVASIIHKYVTGRLVDKGRRT